MKSTVVDESLSSYKPMYCSREYQASTRWVHSVIFEPQPKNQLTQSSHKVTSFLDFQPFLQGFQSVAEYLNDLIADIDDPTYYQ